MIRFAHVAASGPRRLRGAASPSGPRRGGNGLTRPLVAHPTNNPSGA
jgi:hypothetical protein